jgi:acetaldehyde dehydrogenase (acetylating)
MKGVFQRGTGLKVVIQMTSREELKALPILMEHSPGMMLRDRIYIISEEAASALRGAGVRYTLLGRESNIPSMNGAIPGERV